MIFNLAAVAIWTLVQLAGLVAQATGREQRKVRAIDLWSERRGIPWWMTDLLLLICATAVMLFVANRERSPVLGVMVLAWAIPGRKAIGWLIHKPSRSE